MLKTVLNESLAMRSYNSAFLEKMSLPLTAIVLHFTFLSVKCSLQKPGLKTFNLFQHIVCLNPIVRLILGQNIEGEPWRNDKICLVTWRSLVQILETASSLAGVRLRKSILPALCTGSP